MNIAEESITSVASKKMSPQELHGRVAICAGVWASVTAGATALAAFAGIVSARAEGLIDLSKPWPLIAIAATVIAAFAGLVALVYTRAENKHLKSTIAQLGVEQAKAHARAEVAMENAARLNERAEQLEFKSQQLRGENLKLERDLEKLRRPRWLVFNAAAFENALRDSPKMDVQIWHSPDDAESKSLLDLELMPALKKAGWNIAEVRPFVPTADFISSTPLSVQVGLNNNPVDILVSTEIFWETVPVKDGVTTAPNALAKAFEASGICWGSLTPKAHWGNSPIPTNAIRIIVYPKNR